MAASAELSMRQVLGISNFRKLWLATVVSVFGDFLGIFTVLSTMTFRMHASVSAITLVTVSFLLPPAILGPMAGVFVDRWHPRRTMVASDLVRAVLVLGMIFARVPWHINAVCVALSTFSSFFNPARSVIIPQILPLHGLMGANAVIKQSTQILQMLSPMLAGALASWAGPVVCYYLDSASFAFSGIILATIAIPMHPVAGSRQVKPVLHDLLSGIRFISSQPVIRFVILSIMAGALAISAFGSLVPIFVRDVLHSNSVLFGALGSAIGAGTLVGGLIIMPLARRFRHEVYLVSVGILLCGVSIGTIARIPSAIVPLVGCVVIGLGSSLFSIASATLMQGQVLAEMRGRVSGSSMALISMSQCIALLCAGPIASRFGIAALFYGSAAVLSAVAITGVVSLGKPLNTTLSDPASLELPPPAAI